MFSGRFVGHFRELADEFLEDISHLVVGDMVWMQVDVIHKFCHNKIKQIRLVQSGDLRVYVKGLQNRSRIFGETLDIISQVIGDVRGIIF